ncbi:unnamed protein product, partial [marine sediment metagenome]
MAAVHKDQISETQGFSKGIERGFKRLAKGKEDDTARGKETFW